MTSSPGREAVLIGYGFEYLVMAVNCARSLKANNPTIATVLVTNIAVDAEVVAPWFDRVVVRDEETDRNRLVKTSVLDFVEAEEMMYLDADAEVIGDLRPAFRLLQRFDIVLRTHDVPVHKPFVLDDGVPAQLFPHMSGRIFLLRAGEAGKGFLRHWQRRMVESGLSRDQPGLARTVWDLPRAPLILLNVPWLDTDVGAQHVERGGEPGGTGMSPRVLHYKHPHADRRIAQRLHQTVEALAARLPSEMLSDPEVVRVREKLRRVSHPLFWSRFTRRAFLSFAHRRGLRRLGVSVNVLHRPSVAEGLPYTRDVGRLWDE